MSDAQYDGDYMADELPDKETIKAFNNSVIDEFRANGGKVGGPFEGADLILLTTKGAKTGQPRTVVLTPVPIDGKLLVVGSLAGADIDPAWVHNLRANPQARVEAGTDSHDVVARELPTAERDATFPTVAAVEPTYAEYQAKTTRAIPLFELQCI